MAITTKDISPADSMAVQLQDFVLEAGTHYADSSREAVKRFLPYLEVKEVVDLGCGDGAATPFFKEAGVAVIGVDINETKLSLNPTITVTRDIVTYLDAYSDIPNIFMHHALEHLPNPEKVLGLIGKKLANKGCVYIEVPAEDHIHSVHHSTFGSPKDILPEGLELLESGTDDAHYIIARKV